MNRPLPPLPEPESLDDQSSEPTHRTQEIETLRFNPTQDEDVLGPEVADPSRLKLSSRDINLTAKLGMNGRINANFALLDKAEDVLLKYLAEKVEPEAQEAENGKRALKGRGGHGVPTMSILLLIVGSRGDVQPYIALGLALAADGHRVRLGTHAEFKKFVYEAGRGRLEFFDIGGDPRELMSYMVKNPGLIPGFESLTNGDIAKKTKMVFEIMAGSFKGALYPNPATGERFAADAIIANPPVFSHIHIAEYLGIPLQMTFTMPWTPTSSFCHPLVQIDSKTTEPKLANFLSYSLASQITWQGLSNSINVFRTKTLGLDPLSTPSGAPLLDQLKLPWIYSFSPGLIPKPKDWRHNLDVAGFFFLDLASDYKPPDCLEAFLQAGSKPVYIGFGSVPVKDPKAMSRILFEAVRSAGVRAIISTGWAGLDDVPASEDVFLLNFPVPHDYLFTRMSAVVHHGGAGTTAIGLLNGLPTLIVPFFGDQIFWGQMVKRAGAGPTPIPSKQLNEINLAAAIRFLLSNETAANARALGEKIRGEDGVKMAVDAFYRHLPVNNMICDVDPSRVAVWWSHKYALRLSAFAAQVLIRQGKLKPQKLQLHRSKEYDTKKEATDPVTGSLHAAAHAVKDLAILGIGQLTSDPVAGATKIVTTIPKAAINTAIGLSEGFVNLPKVYGSKVRRRRRVTGFGSGLSVGIKSFYFGFHDGIAGLGRDPAKGSRKHGALGVAKGVGRSLVNLGVMPAAGAVSLFISPLTGLYLSCRSLFSDTDESRLKSIRTADGIDEEARATEPEMYAILERFEALTSKKKIVRKRKRETNRKAKRDFELGLG